MINVIHANHPYKYQLNKSINQAAVIYFLKKRTDDVTVTAVIDRLVGVAKRKSFGSVGVVENNKIKKKLNYWRIFARFKGISDFN